MKGAIQKAFVESARTAEDFLQQNQDAVIEVINLLADTFRKGRKVFFFGNGGSAATAQRLAAALVNRVRQLNKGLPAIALTANPSLLTGIADELGFSKVFSQQIEALGKVDDVAVALSVSGKASNLVEGVAAARRLGMVTVALSGGDGGVLARECDYRLIVPSADSRRIQECHLLAGHVICEMVGRALHSSSATGP